MTGKEIYEALNDYLKAQPMPAWAEKELAEAAELGLTDGKDPMALIPRYQAVQTLFVLENLDNLRKNGRLTKMQALVTGALRVKLLCGATREGE